MSKAIKTCVNSEIGTLEGVILHTPGAEIENMTPENAERALYSDILNISVASKEYMQLEGVLNKITKTYQVKDLLTGVLKNEKVKSSLVNKICTNENALDIKETLIHLKPEELSKLLIEGVVMKKDTLSKYLNPGRFSLAPLHNFFFTRDASVSINNKILICKMAGIVRARESIIMEAIFDYSSVFSTKTINPINKAINCNDITIEGGDVLIAREDILLIGLGGRTTSDGIDFIIEKFCDKNEKKHIIIQELPDSPESFIHLDMVFTFLDTDKCMVYEPLILKPNKHRTIYINVENRKAVKISEEKNLLLALSKLGMDLKPVFCGGNQDIWIQEREQWHSGANFFSVGPGKIIGYERNIHTIEEVGKNNFEIIKAEDVINGKKDLNKIDKYVVTIAGSELARGGGGCRCMTMPVLRKDVNW